MQSDLFSAPPPGGVRDTHNLFFALVPDDATCQRMADAAEQLRAGNAPQGRWINPRRYHLTLHFLGTFHPLREGVVASACKAADGLRVDAFDLVLDRAGGFARNHVGWLGCGQTDVNLQRLWEQLRVALAHERVRVEGASRFVPHVTMLRDARELLAEQDIEPVHWPVREFVLIDSQLGSRNVYQTLGRWSLE